MPPVQNRALTTKVDLDKKVVILECVASGQVLFHITMDIQQSLKHLDAVNAAIAIITSKEHAPKLIVPPGLLK